jgi:branched-chain amino acid transport system permease protein
LQGVPRGKLLGMLDLGHDLAMYYVVLGIVIAGFALIMRTVHSPFGQVLKGIRENEARSISLGYHVSTYKLIAFIISAFVAGIAGATKAIVFGLATSTDVHFQMSGDVVLMTLLGGLGTIFGPIVGAMVVTAMEQYFAQFADWVAVIQGTIFVACVMLFRAGIVGTIGNKLKLGL